MIRAVLFDLDGTLLDHDTAVRRGTGSLHAAVLGRLADPGFEAFLAHWQRVTDRHLPAYFAGEIDFATQRLRRIRELFARCGAACDETEAARYFQCYLEAYEGAWALYDDVTGCLEALVGLSLGIVTNGDSEQQRAKLDRTGLYVGMRTVVVSGDLGIHKPDARLFRHACEQIGAAPGETAYVGDLLDTDARGASAAGLYGIWLDRFGAQEPLDGVPVIRGLAELPALLRR